MLETDVTEGSDVKRDAHRMLERRGYPCNEPPPSWPPAAPEPAGAD